MLSLIQSNQMEVLSEQLAKMLATPLAHSRLLANEQVLVQSPGMSTWLRLEIARHNGIAAALEFPLPSSFIWQLCHQLLPNVPKDNAFTKAAMTWKLMDILPSLLADEDLAPLLQYLGQEEINCQDVAALKRQAIKRYQLCGRIADIFDQYLVYRPEWILAWEQNQDRMQLEPNQLWQPKLWRALVQYNHDELKASAYHRANLHQALLTALSSPDTDLSALPSRLFVFGISSMAPQTLEVLYHLASRIPVVMLALSPCQHYWGEIVDPKTRARMALQYADKKQLAQDWESSLEVGNPLLANNGKLGRELLDLILSLPPEHTDFGYDCYLVPEPSNLLKGVQYDILQMETLGHTLGPDAELYGNLALRRPLMPADDSITLRTCHSPLREVETLHNHLLELLSTRPELHPKDIVVMMPDVAAYAPYIDAVFGTGSSLDYRAGDHDEAKPKHYYIPYAIADRGAAQESPLINSFLNLLNINQSRFGLTDIISILEVPAILRRFGLNDEDLVLIRLWLDDAKVRWGRDETSRTELGIPAFIQNSWAFGIRRLILGYAFKDDAPLYQDILQVNGLEGQSAQALGKLLDFLEVLDTYRNLFAQSHDTQERLVQLQACLQDCYDAQEDEREELKAIHDAIAKLDNELIASGHRGMLDIEVLKIWFNQTLSESRVGQRYLAGSVNFCTLMPMRSIPFKLVCLLGMNDGDYPRMQHPVGFDLMAHFGAKKGDRSRRADDRYLFLEALLSARDQLYISYIGHSERDNGERIPSMLVSELIEYCQLSYCPQALLDQQAESADKEVQEVLIEQAGKAVLDQLIQAQPLQPFDARLFKAVQENGKPLQQSYHSQWCPPAADFALSGAFFDLGDTLPAGLMLESLIDDASGQTLELELSALLRFYRNPGQFFFNRSLKVDLSLDIQADDNDEPFSLNALERYLLQAKLLDHAIHSLDRIALGEDESEQDSQALHLALKASGSLPMAPFDELLLTQYRRDLAPLIGRVAFLKGLARDGEREASSPTAISLDLDLLFDLEQAFKNDVITSQDANHRAQLRSALSLRLNDDEPKLRLVGRIDNIMPKGQISYRPGAAHGRDLIRVYLRHLCLNATGQHKMSYLLDMAQFHSFAPLSAEQAKAQLGRFILGFLKGQIAPLCFMPRTALAYVQAQGDHRDRLLEAQKYWRDEQSQLGEGFEPHNRRLFRFPQDFSEQGFGALAQHLLAPMLSLYQVGKLAELEYFVLEGFASAGPGAEPEPTDLKHSESEIPNPKGML